MKHGVFLVVPVLVFAQSHETGSTVPSVTAYRVQRPLTTVEKNQLNVAIRDAGAERVENPVLDSYGVIVVKNVGGRVLEIPRVLSGQGGLPALQRVGVENSRSGIVIHTGRYLVYFDEAVQPCEAERRLTERKFEILDPPSRYLPAYRVERSSDPKEFASDLQVLRNLEGVKLAVNDNPTVNLRD